MAGGHVRVEQYWVCDKAKAGDEVVSPPALYCYCLRIQRAAITDNPRTPGPVPPGAVTARGTVPAAPAGEIAWSVVSLSTEKSMAAFPSNVTALVPVKPVPVIVTIVAAGYRAKTGA